MKQHALILRQLDQAARSTEKELDQIRKAIAALRNRSTHAGRRQLTAAARAKIGAAQRKRWAVFHREQKAEHKAA